MQFTEHKKYSLGFDVKKKKHIYTYFYLPSIHVSLQSKFSSLPPSPLMEYSCLGIEVAGPGPARYKATLCALQLGFVSSVFLLHWREMAIEPSLEASTQPPQDTDLPLTQTPVSGSPLNQRKSEYLNIIIWFQRNQTMPIFEFLPSDYSCFVLVNTFSSEDQEHQRSLLELSLVK